MGLFSKKKVEKQYQEQVFGKSDSRPAIVFANQLYSSLPSISSHIDRYRYSYALRSAIDILASNSTRIKPEVFKNDEKQDKHPIQLLLDRCNPDEPASSFWHRLYIESYLYGEVYIKIWRGLSNRRPSAISILPASMIRINQSNDTYIYQLIGRQGYTENIDKNDVIHITTYTGNGLIGISPLDSIVALIDMEIQARVVQQGLLSGKMYKNLISLDIDDETERDNWQTYLEAIQGVSNSGGFAMIPKALTKENIIDLAQNMPTADQFDALYRQVMMAVAMVYRIPTDYLTTNYVQNKYANANENRKRLYDEVIIPNQQIIFDTMAFKLGQEYKDLDIEIIPNISKVDALQANQTELSIQFQTYVSAGMKPEIAYELVHGTPIEANSFVEPKEIKETELSEEQDDGIND